MPQRAKLRRLAFIDLPSWSRGSRPLSLGSTRESLGRLHYNLGVAPVAAKGTTQDYLAHSSAIPVQMMALKGVSSRVVKDSRGNMTPARNMRYLARLRRAGAGSTRIRPSIRLTSAPARVCFSLGFGRRPEGFCASARSNADSK